MSDAQKKVENTTPSKPGATTQQSPANTSAAPGAPVKTEAQPAAKKATVKKKPAKKTTAKKAAPKKKTVKKTTAKKQSLKAASGVKSKTLKTDYFANTQTMETMMTKGKTQMDQMAKEATELNRMTMEAMMKSTSIFAKGCEEMMRMGMAMAQDTTAKQTQYMKEALSSKTLNEWTEVQSKIAQGSFDDFMSGATQISELGVKTFSDAVEPINTQLTKTVQKASTIMAA